MTLKKFLQIVSFGLLFYLLVDSFMHFDFAASKNDAFTSMQKTEVDTIQNIDTVKTESKRLPWHDSPSTQKVFR